MPLSHIILHLSLCNSMLHVPPEARIPVRVQLTDRIGRPQMDRTFLVQRGYDPAQIVEFDTTFGLYKMKIDSPRYGCGAVDYLAVMTDHGRSVDEHLVEGTPASPQPTIFEGSAPESFGYAKPTFVLFDKSLTCNKPVGDPLSQEIQLENDGDAYYASLYATPDVVAHGSVTLALQLNTPTGEHHYIRVPIPYPQPWYGWPYAVNFNLTEEELDTLSSSPTDTLLCPKILKTSAG